MNAPLILTPELLDLERRTLLARIDELEREIAGLRIGEHADHVVPPELDRAIRDLLGRLDARDDVGAPTRLAIQAVRQELQAASPQKEKGT